MKKGKNNKLEYEFEKKIVENIDKNEKLEIDKGTNFLNGIEEWNKQRLVNFNENFEKVESFGKNADGEWKEEWFEKGNEKWTKK
jgi:hypothetical protein